MFMGNADMVDAVASICGTIMQAVDGHSTQIKGVAAQLNAAVSGVRVEAFDTLNGLAQKLTSAIQLLQTIIQALKALAEAIRIAEAAASFF